MQQIECSDFERYYFPIPLRMIFGRKQSRFVYSELEKRHPCFSEDYNFDVHVKLQKNKLISDVDVIKNQKLLELKRENISGLFGIKFEGCKHKRFAKLNILPIAFILFFLIFISSLFLLCSGSSESD